MQAHEHGRIKEGCDRAAILKLRLLERTPKLVNADDDDDDADREARLHQWSRNAQELLSWIQSFRACKRLNLHQWTAMDAKLSALLRALEPLLVTGFGPPFVWQWSQKAAAAQSPRKHIIGAAAESAWERRMDLQKHYFTMAHLYNKPVADAILQVCPDYLQATIDSVFWEGPFALEQLCPLAVHHSLVTLCLVLGWLNVGHQATTPMSDLTWLQDLIADEVFFR
ncbi:hypothetical protein PWT90_09312 [Aphanocladium album]|nr:hypothetical protein PWT90_09312 [Aphanocladium album]